MASIAENAGMSTPRPSPFEWLRERLGASDPAFSRLRMASRALLSLLVGGGVVALIGLFVHPLPVASYGLAGVVTFAGGIAVRDKTLSDQFETRAWAWAASIASILTASLLAPIQLWSDVAFLAVVFAAVYIRAFGQRWFAVGLIAFMAYFIGDYLKAAPADIGWLALASGVAFAATQLVSGYLLRDDPERDFRRALVTIEQRIEAILRRAPVVKVDQPGMQRQLDLLRDAALMAEGFIPQGEAGSLAARGPASDLAIALFDVQLAVERMARASYAAPPPPELVAAVLEGRTLHESETDGIAGRLVLRVGLAWKKLKATLGPTPSPAFMPTRNNVPVAAKAAAQASAGSRPLVPVAYQLPIQVTLACGIAMGVGYLDSSTRWYWAVLTAFIVFNNTKSRGDTAVRALQRSAGTLAGLIGGTLLATLLSGHIALSSVALLILFFLAFYYLQVSYTAMIFMITLGLALIYGLMGTFTPELLVERLTETVIGSIAGAGVAFLVFPSRTVATAAGALNKYLGALADLIGAARARAKGEPEPHHLLARSRLLDSAYTDVAAAARPLGGPWGAVTRFGNIRRRLLLLSGIAHWSRVLARSLPKGGVLSEGQVARIGELAGEIEAGIDQAEAARDSFFDRPSQHHDVPPRAMLPITEDADPVLALEAIAALIVRAAPPETKS